MTLLADRGEAALGAQLCPDLSRLIHPIDLATFQRDYWERRYLRVRRDDPGYYAELLTLDDVDRALSLSGIGLDHLRVVADGKETPVAELRGASSGSTSRPNALEALYERYRTGSTIALNFLDQRWEPMQRLAQALGAEISCRVQMNVYLTPPGAQGFRPHYDMHDVFIAQVYGAKHWRLAAPPLELPLHNQPYDNARPEPEVLDEFDLYAGDLLYLPRGTVHSATSAETASVHITIGIHPVLYSQVVEHAIARLCTEDVRFRRGLPIGFATDAERQREAAATLAELLDVARSAVSPEDIVADSVRRATSIGPSVLRNHLTDLEKLGEVAVDTPVRRRPGLRWSLSVADGRVRLDFHDKTIELPAQVAEEVRYAAERDRFTAGGIPGDLDEDGRMVLVRTMLREGFLTLC